MNIHPSVLVIDDNKDVRTIISDLLASKGYTPLGAADGNEALRIIDEQTIPVAIVDLMLPDMGGLDIIGEIKKRSYAMECIVLTAHASQESAIEAVKLGAYSYIQKPYDADQLLLTVKRAFEKRMAEEERKERIAELEHLNNELKTMQMELIQSGKLSAIGQMAAEMAHEINNPLGTIRIRIDELKQYLADPSLDRDEAIEAIDAISRSADMIVQVINRMRYFSKPSDDEYKVTDINASIATALDMLKPHLNKKSIHLVEEIHPEPLTCFGNANMLEQLFTNLIINSMDALLAKDEKERSIIIETAPRNDTHITVVIRDNGQGMDERTRDELFNPFFTTRPEGVGLGLAIVKRIIDAHRGEVAVDSEPDGGTTFTIILPRDRRRAQR